MSEYTDETTGEQKQKTVQFSTNSPRLTPSSSFFTYD